MRDQSVIAALECCPHSQFIANMGGLLWTLVTKKAISSEDGFVISTETNYRV